MKIVLLNAMFCSIACFLVFLGVVSRFKGHFIHSFSILCPFLIVQCTFDRLGCTGCCFAAFLWGCSLLHHSRKLQINQTYLKSGMLFEKKKKNSTELGLSWSQLKQIFCVQQVVTISVLEQGQHISQVPQKAAEQLQMAVPPFFLLVSDLPISFFAPASNVHSC